MAKQTTSEPDLPRSSFSGLPSIFAKGELDSQDETMSGSAAGNDTSTKPTTMSKVLTTASSSATRTGACFGHTNNNVLNRNYNASMGRNGNSRIYSNIMSTTFSEAAKIRGGGGAATPAAVNAVEAIDDDDVDIDGEDMDVYVHGLGEIVMPPGSADGRLSAATTGTLPRRRDTAREILYSKFGEFLVARLNSLQEVSSNELMNQILVLIAEK